ncbi:zinc finger protein 771 isoform X3 [Anastrepha obliqua]|uniref:zinc finger protein 771 isoform X3 n=1 Tax=Anastrepha obliqua TaxID=95512 RepID=UPI00240A31E1|nr:zinc finger protein 771 isoform X3 [Anastrepha obliqua]
MMQSAESAIPLSDNPTEYIDLSDYCRLCLQVPDESQLLDLQLIYDEEEQLSYYDCFTVCTQIDLRAGGTNAPHQLCKSCGLELQVAYDFHKKVEESKIFLEQLDQSQQLGDEVSPLTTTMKIERHGEPEDVGEVEVKTNEPQLVESLPAESEPIENDIVAGQDDTVGHFETSMEYEELEDQIDMDEYQSVDELVDEDIRKDERILSIKLEEDSAHFPVEVSYEESSAHCSKNETSKNPPVLMNMAPPSDADDINLAEYLFENPDLLTKAQAADEQLHILSKPRKRGRAPLIPGGPPFQCEYCDHKSPSRSLLASHRHRKHRFNKSPNRCAECGKEFATKQQLERHQQRVTCQSYPVFNCEFCEKTCIGRANYQIHLRFHKKVYPFVCHICAKPFMMAQHLNNHVKTKHEGQRFICEQPECGKMFQTAHALKNHAYTHVDQLPYRCDYCQHDFPTKGRLRWHISRIHGIEHTLDELDCMLVAKEIKLKAQLRPVLTPEPEVIAANELEGYAD